MLVLLNQLFDVMLGGYLLLCDSCSSCEFFMLLKYLNTSYILPSQSDPVTN